MMYFIAALVCAGFGVFPLVFATKAKYLTAALLQGIVTALFWYAVFYFATPSTVWPVMGIFGFAVFINWFIATVVTAQVSESRELGIAVLFPLFFLAAYITIFVAGWEFFRAQEYAHMLGPVETRVWTQDVQPKDPEHMRMSTMENASYVAKKALGQAGAIGSQFQVSEKHLTLQVIKGELWYVVPLDFSGFSPWLNANGAPGYIMVHGEDSYAGARMVQQKDGERFRYMPGAFFGDNLERHLRTHGFLNVGFSEFKFEIDDAGRPWWVVSVFTPTIMWSGEKTLGVLLVDPVTGEIVRRTMSQIPEWVDRVIPSDFVKRYIGWNGKLTGGWLNSWWAMKDLVEPEVPSLIYGAGGQPDWVTGVTSTNNNDDSLVGVMYTNSRNGKSVFYKVPGGGTDASVLEAVNRNQQVQFKHLHGADPQLYNVSGTMASVVPLLNDSHAFQGVAIVSIMNVQVVAVGQNQYEALREYQTLMRQSGQQVALNQAHEADSVEGVLDRFSFESFPAGTIYYLHLAGVPHGFTGGSAAFPKLPLTHVGDSVRIGSYASDEDFIPMTSFENMSLLLSATRAQTAIRERAAARHETADRKAETRSFRRRIDSMNDEELRKLMRETK